jgi:malonyl-CoA decarboxylase
MDKVSGHSLALRDLSRIRDTWRHLAGGAGKFGDEKLAVTLSQRQIDHLHRVLGDCVAEVGGEVTARQRAAQIGELYLSLDDAGKRDVLHLIVSEFGPQPGGVDAAIRAWQQASGAGPRREAEAALRRALASPRTRILTQFNALPDGVRFLVEMRADVLRLLSTHGELAILDAELEALLSSWFDVGFLTLHRLTWNSPAALLEKLIAYEAVHEIRSWADLRKRLDADRRCYAFFHPRMPDEPLIFVEVALTRAMAGNVQSLLDEAREPLDPARADTAIFYSISNTQKGLRGVSFGNFLIKRVVAALKQDYPRLKTFATLSPIPGFGRWLARRLEEEGDALLGSQERAALREVSGSGRLPALRSVLALEGWAQRADAAAALQAPLMRLCAHYLAHEQEQGWPLDPVARFHLGNGARIERLNWLADTAPKGMAQAAGMMVNYLYELEEIEANLEAYARRRAVATASGFRRLLRRPR